MLPLKSDTLRPFPVLFKYLIRIRSSNAQRILFVQISYKNEKKRGEGILNRMTIFTKTLTSNPCHSLDKHYQNRSNSIEEFHQPEHESNKVVGADTGINRI
jgi:hypothetical protein